MKPREIGRPLVIDELELPGARSLQLTLDPRSRVYMVQGMAIIAGREQGISTSYSTFRLASIGFNRLARATLHSLRHLDHDAVPLKKAA